MVPPDRHKAVSSPMSTMMRTTISDRFSPLKIMRSRSRGTKPRSRATV